jgi:hypothetical protein
LQAEFTRVWEAAVAAKAITAAEVARITVVLAMENSAQEAVVAWDSVIARVKDVEDQATLA